MGGYSRRLINATIGIKGTPIVAPANFNEDLEPLNINAKFRDYQSADKKAGYIFSDTYNTLTLALLPGFLYHYGYTRGGINYNFEVDTVVNPFSASIDTKRWVIVKSSNNDNCEIPFGATWLCISGSINSFTSTSNTYLKYVHYHGEPTFTTLSGDALKSTNVEGILTIPPSVSIIGPGAFLSCTKITGNLVIPPNVTYIGNGSFFNCNGLTGDLVIPSTVTSVGNESFMRCSGMSGLIINCVLSNLIDHNNNPFSETAFTSIVSNSSMFEMYDSVLYHVLNGNYTALACIKNVSTSLTFHPSTIAVSRRAFYKCTRTGTLTIPSTIQRIGEFGFWESKMFTGNLVIPNNVDILKGTSVFNGMTNLNGYIAIPANIAIVAAGVFGNLSNVQEYRIYSDVAPTVVILPNINPTFTAFAKPLRVLATTTSFNTVPWTDTNVFSTITKDL